MHNSINLFVEKLIEKKKSWLWGYEIAIVAVAIATILKLLLTLIVPAESPYCLYFAAVTVSSLYGGRQVGIFATILSALMSDYFFLTPTHTLSVSSLGQNLWLVIFICEGLLISRLVSALHWRAQKLKALAELQLERDRLETILQQMPMGILMAEATTGKIIFGNQEIKKICPDSFIPNENIQQYKHYKSFDSDIQAYQHQATVLARTIVDGEAIKNEEITVLRDDGTYGTILANSTPLYDDEGKIEAGVIAFLDISDHVRTETKIRQLNQELEQRVIERTQALQTEIQERIKIEADLRESEEKFRTTFNHVAVGIVHANLDGQYQLINQKLCDIFGYTEAEMTKLSIADISYPEDLKADLENTQRVLAGEIQSFSMEKRYIRKDGAIVWGNLTVSILREANGEPKYLIGVVEDISDRKLAEDALRKSEEQFRNLADSMPQLVWTTSPDGAVDYYNHRVNEFSGFVQKQDGTWQWQPVLHPDDQQRTLAAWQHAVATGEIYECEHRVKRIDGEFRWHLSRGTPVKNGQGRIVKWYGTATDIHTQKQYQAEREELLRREQLARTEAESANRMKDEFLATLSHELRTPMNAMLGWTSMLRTRKLNEATISRALETIERSTKTLNQLIEDILDVSRIIRGKVRLTLQPLQVQAVIEQAIETLKPSAETKNIQVLIEPLPETSLKVMGDSSRLQQIVWNLLANAIKFTPKGGCIMVRLSVVEERGNREQRTGKEDKENIFNFYQSPVTQYAQIQVTDTGIGIAPEFLPHVFDRFRQADGSITRSHGGLGLGLAIVRHLVELHGGTVDVHSLGASQGATFTVKLPLVVDNVGTDEQETRGDDSSQLGSDSLLLKDLQVLVVDDEPDIRDLVTLILEDRGAKVTSVNSAQVALTALQKLHPDIIVSDIGMPEDDGYSLIRQIRTLPPEAGGQIPAIALTAYAGAEDRNATLNAGFNRHMAKPVEPTELIMAIANLISS